MSLTRPILRELLSLPARAERAKPEILSSKGTRTELKLNGVPATFLRPDVNGRVPAVLFCHAHGGEYALGRRELTEGARWLSAPVAGDLVEAGFDVLCLDMPGFGGRRSEGTESGLAKAGLWQGLPLFGLMLSDLQSAFEWLANEPGIDGTRIATLGISMGGAHALWLAGIEPRIAAAAHLCIFANVGPLIETGIHDRHGPYLTVPGLLKLGDVGDVAALIAPRPQFAGLGALDDFTPKAAREPALDRVRAAYGEGPFESYLSPETGHLETPEMRRAVLDFLSRAVARTTEVRAS